MVERNARMDRAMPSASQGRCHETAAAPAEPCRVELDRGPGRRIRWWLRTGALLTILGVLRLARTARVRWEPVCLLAGAVIAGTGFALPAGGGLFMLGLLVLIVTLVKGIAAQQRRRDPAR